MHSSGAAAEPAEQPQHVAASGDPTGDALAAALEQMVAAAEDGRLDGDSATILGAINW